jgi:hypothetical protein
VPDISIPLLGFAGVVAWLAVLGRLRLTTTDSRIVGAMLLVAIFLFAGSLFYIGLPFQYASGFNVLARVVVLGAALLLLLRHDP